MRLKSFFCWELPSTFRTLMHVCLHVLIESLFRFELLGTDCAFEGIMARSDMVFVLFPGWIVILMLIAVELVQKGLNSYFIYRGVRHSVGRDFINSIRVHAIYVDKALCTVFDFWVATVTRSGREVVAGDGTVFEFVRKKRRGFVVKRLGEGLRDRHKLLHLVQHIHSQWGGDRRSHWVLQRIHPCLTYYVFVYVLEDLVLNCWGTKSIVFVTFFHFVLVLCKLFHFSINLLYYIYIIIIFIFVLY